MFFCHCGYIWPFLLANGIAFVAAEIATYVMTDVTVIVD